MTTKGNQTSNQADSENTAIAYTLMKPVLTNCHFITIINEKSCHDLIDSWYKTWQHGARCRNHGMQSFFLFCFIFGSSTILAKFQSRWEHVQHPLVMTYRYLGFTFVERIKPFRDIGLYDHHDEKRSLSIFKSIWDEIKLHTSWSRYNCIRVKTEC